nr:MAG TPA: hypothetical protein [Caudoviricetes sp.]
MRFTNICSRMSKNSQKNRRKTSLHSKRRHFFIKEKPLNQKISKSSPQKVHFVI